MTRRFEMEEGGSRKFWEIGVDGSVLTVRFGRLGTDGQTKPKDLGSADAAAKEAAKLIAEKTKKGYVEVGPPRAVGPAPLPAPAPAAPAAPPSTPTPPSAPAAPSPPTVSAPPAPAGPSFSKVYTDGANREVTWGCTRTDWRRRIDPDASATIAAIVRGWTIEVRSREEAVALLERVSALPGDAPREPAAVLAGPGWEFDARPRAVVVGAILAARASDSAGGVLAWAHGPGGAPVATLRARESWASEWIGAAFAGVSPATSAPPSTLLVVAGQMGDAYVAVGTLGGKIPGLPFARRTSQSDGKKHRDGLVGVLLAHAAWDEETHRALDLSEAALTDPLSRVASSIAKPLLVIGASYDSRS